MDTVTSLKVGKRSFVVFLIVYVSWVAGLTWYHGIKALFGAVFFGGVLSVLTMALCSLLGGGLYLCARYRLFPYYVCVKNRILINFGYRH
ncbi:MAG: hypothetical protein HYY92_01920 [Parcubacteria group bacterium]|nr:hypothetical protein [Parcubacteria group bacterium]